MQPLVYAITRIRKLCSRADSSIDAELTAHYRILFALMTRSSDRSSHSHAYPPAYALPSAPANDRRDTLEEVHRFGFFQPTEFTKMIGVARWPR